MCNYSLELQGVRCSFHVNIMSYYIDMNIEKLRIYLDILKFQPISLRVD